MLFFLYSYFIYVWIIYVWIHDLIEDDCLVCTKHDLLKFSFFFFFLCSCSYQLISFVSLFKCWFLSLQGASATKSHFPLGIIQLFYLNILFPTLASFPFLFSSRQSQRCRPYRKTLPVLFLLTKTVRTMLVLTMIGKHLLPKQRSLFTPHTTTVFPSFFVAAHASVTQSAV